MLTLVNISRTGVFSVEDDKTGENLGEGKAMPSKNKPGMVTLVFPPLAAARMHYGLRVPTNWLVEGTYDTFDNDRTAS